MDQENRALNLLLDAVLEAHRSARHAHGEDDDVDFVDFSDDEIALMVKTLWVDRYATSRKPFEDTVSECVLRKVSAL